MSRLLFPLMVGVLGTGVLIALALWQVQRLAWKESVIAEMQAQIAADPVPVPAAPDPLDDRYLPVTATGTITGEELHVLVPTEEFGPSFRVIALFESDDGRRLMLDRGVVPEGAKYTEREPVEANITGNLLWPDEVDIFTPDPDIVSNVWFARDADAMARQLGAEPFMIVLRDTSETSPPVTPMPLDTRAIPNNHLQYALTWFGLALVWIAMTVFWIVRIALGKR